MGRRPLNLGAPATTIGLQQVPKTAAPRAAPREDNTRAATAYGMAEALAEPIQVESGTWGEAIAEALAGGLRGRAARSERLSELDQRDVARALEREQANQELKGEIQDRDLRAQALEGTLAGNQTENDFRERQFAETQRHNRASEGIAGMRMAQAPARPLRGPDAALLTRTRQAAESARGLRGLTQEFAGNLERQDTFPGSGVQVWDPEVRNMSAMAARMTGLMRPVGSGATSDFEQRLYARGAPSVDNTREANRAIIASIQRLGEIADARQFFYEDYASANGTLNGAERAFQQSPEFQALAVEPAGPAGPDENQQPQSQQERAQRIRVDANGNLITR